MKYVQIAILAALVVVAALLFSVWKGQQPAPPPVTETQQAQPAATPPATPETAPGKPEPAAKPAPQAARKPGPAGAAAREVAATTSTPAPAAETAAPRPETAATHPPAEPAAAAPKKELPPPPPRKVTLDAGTLIPVRLAEALSTERVKAGETFAANLDRALVVDGLVIAERGSRVEGKIVEAEQAGRVRGVAHLGIQLVRLRTSDGQDVAIQTEIFRKDGPTTKGADAAKVGAGAGIGAAVGAIAGGGRGAAIGAAVGGAAGAGTVAATRGKPAELASETRIEFRLSAPVTVTERSR